MTLGIYYFVVTLVWLSPTGVGSPDYTKSYADHFRSKNACIVNQQAFGRMANSAEYQVEFPTNKVITYWTDCAQVVIKGYEV